MNSSRDESGRVTLHELVGRLLGEISNAWRFRWYGAATAWLGFLIGWGIVSMQPSIYEASARVFVDTSSVLRPILRNQIVVPVDVRAQLNYVREALLGREQLERVAHANGLDTNVTTDAALDRVVNGLRTSLSIKNQDRTQNVFLISYRSSDRTTAIGVVSTLLTSLVEDTMGANQESSDTASRFLDERIAEYEGRLQEAERALAEFKKRNADSLPGTEGGYFAGMRIAKTALEEAQKSLRVAESRRDELKAQLQSESPVLPGGQSAEPAPNSLDARIRDYRVQLDRFLLSYTERHPDVVSVREALAGLEAQRAEQLRGLGISNGDQELLGVNSSPVYQAVQIALNEAEVEIASRQADIADRSAKLDELQSRVDEVPDVEAELARLNRDYSVIYSQYKDLVESRETQNLSQKAFDEDEVEFRVIDPPSADFKPVAPDRSLLLAGVFIVALGLGGAVCWLLAQLRPVFATAAALREVCQLPVVGVVSHVAVQEERARRRLALIGFVCAIGGLGVLFGVATVIERVGLPS